MPSRQWTIGHWAPVVPSSTIPHSNQVSKNMHSGATTHYYAHSLRTVVWKARHHYRRTHHSETGAPWLDRTTAHQSKWADMLSLWPCNKGTGHENGERDDQKDDIRTGGEVSPKPSRVEETRLSQYSFHYYHHIHYTVHHFNILLMKTFNF